MGSPQAAASQLSQPHLLKDHTWLKVWIMHRNVLKRDSMPQEDKIMMWWISQKLRCLVRGPYNKNCSIGGFILGSPYFAKLPCRKSGGKKVPWVLPAPSTVLEEG